MLLGAHAPHAHPSTPLGMYPHPCYAMQAVMTTARLLSSPMTGSATTAACRA